MKLNTIIQKNANSICIMNDDIELMSKAYQNNEAFLKIYTWETPAISIGRNQKIESLNIEKIEADKLLVVKRPTGGRSIFHCGDICYSFVYPHSYSNIYGRTITETMSIISNVLINALSNFSVGAYSSNQFQNVKGSCFSSFSKFEILVNEKKLIGSAQYRGENAVLQQGCIPISNKFRNIVKYEHLEKYDYAQNYNRIVNNTICLDEIFETEILFLDVANVIVDSFFKITIQ